MDGIGFTEFPRAGTYGDKLRELTETLRVRVVDTVTSEPGKNINELYAEMLEAGFDERAVRTAIWYTVEGRDVTIQPGNRLLPNN